MKFEIKKEEMKNIKEFKNKTFREYKKNDLRYFLEIKGNDIFVSSRKVSYENLSLDSIFNTSKGVFYAQDEGEFGGYLYKVNKRKYDLVFNGNFKELIDYKDKLFYVESCAHMCGHFSYGFIEELDDHYTIESLKEIIGEYSIEAFKEDDSIYILTCSSLYKFDGINLDKLLELKNSPLNNFRGMSVGNIIVKDGFMYIGLCKRICVINLDSLDISFLGE